MKTHLVYFKHYTNSFSSPKIEKLFSNYKDIEESLAYLGRYWALLEIIASNDNCILDLTDKINVNSYAKKLFLSLNEFEKFILTLKDLKLIKEVGQNKFTTSEIEESFEQVSNEREKARERKKNLFLKMIK